MTITVVDGLMNSPERLEMFLRRQTGIWHTIETAGGIKAMTDVRDEAFNHLDKISSVFAWVQRWENGKRVRPNPDAHFLAGFS